MSKKILDFLKNPGLLFISLGHRGWFHWMNDELYLKIAYRIKMGEKLHLNPPVTFNEKLQWLKLHDRRPEYTTMVDKYEAKKWVAERIGEEYIIPTLGVWNHFDEIDFDKLPNQFVLKCTHDSGGLVICRDKEKLDKKAARKKLENCLKHNFFWGQREWPYKNVKPRIIAEKYMEDSATSELKDYKFYSFRGVIKAMFIATARQKGQTKADYFDMEFKPLPFTWGYPHAKVLPKKPQNFDEMVKIAEILTKDIPQARADFYEVNGKTYFGEITFFDGSGMERFHPESWDKTFGEWLKLPGKLGGYGLINEHLILWVHQSDEKVLTDYKFFCFNGKAKIMYISKDKGERPAPDFFDMEFNRLNIRMEDSNSETVPDKPVCFDTMKRCAEKLSQGIPNLRVDFYVIQGRPYIGELTFFHMSGFAHIHPHEWETELGNWITLPKSID